jgi:hypothetical protein
MITSISGGWATAHPPASAIVSSSVTGNLMNVKNKQIVKAVFIEAVNTPHFFDFSDAQRLNWMINRAYDLGRQEQRTPSRPKRSKRKIARRSKRYTGASLSILVKAH